MLAYFVIWPLIKIALKINNARNQFRRAMEGSGAGARRESHSERKAGWSQSGIKLRRKKIEKDVGEYVAFTEEPATPANAAGPVDNFERESQIEDVEWEDIK